MNKTAIIIQARTGSSRMPEKVILPFFEGRSIIEILIERLLKNCAVPVILATTDSPADDPLAEKASAFPIRIFRGSEENVLDRFIQTSEKFGCTRLVRVCADNPFLDAGAVNQLISAFTKHPSDYLSFRFSGERPSIKTHFGFFAEMTRLDTLRKVASLTSDKLYIEHVTNYIYGHPGRFDLQFLPAPELIFHRSDIRLTLDTPNDFAMQQQIYAELSRQKGTFGIPEIVAYLDAHPEILQQMNLEIEKNSK
ncbi:cytidylyltransferase domain-containing protein [Gaoshiqia sp. Z1-71]|uniref:cytidylyltransferase domain-containing protein n=1 Tax=Gaoshiqia hydrogeniformans TaxID=3290090 RepID=UPI003BF7C863